MTVTFDPPNTTGNTTTMRVAAGAKVTPSSYSITVASTGAEVAPQSATLTVTVAAANTTLRFCDNAPLFAAFQDGSRPWVGAPIVDNAITFHLASGRGAVSYAVSQGNTHVVIVEYGIQGELNATTCAGPAPATTTVHGSVANVGSNEMAWVGVGASLVALQPATGLTFALQAVPNSPTDLVAARLQRCALQSGSRQ